MNYTKDPDATLDWTFNWSAWLDGSETITSYDVNVPTGITLGSGVHAPSQADGVVTYWLSGGTLHSSYRITCHIKTSEGREDDRTMQIAISER